MSTSTFPAGPATLRSALVILTLLACDVAFAEEESPAPSAPAVDVSELDRPPAPDVDVESTWSTGTFRRSTRNPRARMVSAGWATFTSTYVIALVTGAIFSAGEPEIGGPLFVPLVGPMVTGLRIWTWAEGEPEVVLMGMLAWLNAAFQTTSFIIALMGHRERRRTEGRRASSAPPRGASVAVLPGETPGLAVSGWF